MVRFRLICKDIYIVFVHEVGLCLLLSICSDAVCELQTNIQERTGILPDKQMLFRDHIELEEREPLDYLRKRRYIAELEFRDHTYNKETRSHTDIMLTFELQRKCLNLFRYHASLVEKESSGIGSCADEEPEKASFELKVDFQPFGNIRTVDVDTSLAILKVKEKLGESGISPVIQRLFYHDRELQDSSKLSDYSIRKGFVLRLLLIP